MTEEVLGLTDTPEPIYHGITPSLSLSFSICKMGVIKYLTRLFFPQIIVQVEEISILKAMCMEATWQESRSILPAPP